MGVAENGNNAPAVRAPGLSLFGKYFLVIFSAVFVPLFANGMLDAWFGFNEQRRMIAERQRVEVRSASDRVDNFLNSIVEQMRWMVHLPARQATIDQHRIDALRVLRQVSAIQRLDLVMGDGRELLAISRVAVDRIGKGIDRSADPAIRTALANGRYYGQVYFNRGSEPFMTIAVSGRRASSGVIVAAVNLRLIWDTIVQIEVGETGSAFLVDGDGRLIAHPDISRALRGGTGAEARRLDDLLIQVRSGANGAELEWQSGGRQQLVTAAHLRRTGWTVFVQQPLSEAFAPIYGALWRTSVLLIAGGAIAALLAYLLARGITGPIRQLQVGTERIGAGDFEYRIEFTSGDELQFLAENFNKMAAGLGLSHERSMRIERLRRFLAPQVAELVEGSGREHLLETHRTEVVVVFCDLRNFTGFAARSSPEEILGLLNEYLSVLGPIISAYGATQTNFLGDGLMLLINAPIARKEPASDAVDMALEMQDAMQSAAATWQAASHPVGFGIGMALGPASVGQIGYGSRLDYTAIGHVVNLASRLCSLARDGEILVDQSVAKRLDRTYYLESRGDQKLKGLSKAVPVYVVRSSPPDSAGE